jgi:hypothetical protein
MATLSLSAISVQSAADGYDRGNITPSTLEHRGEAMASVMSESAPIVVSIELTLVVVFVLVFRRV